MRDLPAVQHSGGHCLFLGKKPTGGLLLEKLSFGQPNPKNPSLVSQSYGFDSRQ